MDFFLYAPNKIVVLTPQSTSIQNAYGFIKASFYRGLSRLFSKDPQCMDLIKRASSGKGGEYIESVAKLREEFKGLGEDREHQLSEYLEGFQMNLILNMVMDTKQNDISSIVSAVAKNYLNLNISTLGTVQYDKVLYMAINNMAGYLTGKRDNASGYCFYNIARNIMRTSVNCNNVSTIPEHRPFKTSARSDNSKEFSTANL